MHLKHDRTYRRGENSNEHDGRASGRTHACFACPQMRGALVTEQVAGSTPGLVSDIWVRLLRNRLRVRLLVRCQAHGVRLLRNRWRVRLLVWCQTYGVRLLRNRLRVRLLVRCQVCGVRLLRNRLRIRLLVWCQTYGCVCYGTGGGFDPWFGVRHIRLNVHSVCDSWFFFWNLLLKYTNNNYSKHVFNIHLLHMFRPHVQFQKNTSNWEIYQFICVST